MHLPRVIVAPPTDPLSALEAREQLRLDTAVDDPQLVRFIGAARRHIEKVCWRGLVVQVLELTLPGFYEDGEEQALPAWVMPHFLLNRPIRLLGGHLAEVADIATLVDPAPSSPVLFVKYVDESGALVTLDPSAYEVDSSEGDRGVGKIRPVFGTSWPVARATYNAVQIRYAVGWAADDVPEGLKQAALLLVAQQYEDREGTQLGGAAFGTLIDPYRLSRISR